MSSLPRCVEKQLDSVVQSPKGLRLNSLGGKLGLLLGGLLMGILLAEATARFIAPNQAADLLFNASDASPMNLYIIDNDTRVTTAPNIDASIESLDYSVKIKTNKLGLRGPALSKTSPKTEHWIAVGDSFTMSVQVDQEDTFSGKLSTMSGAQVWNAGVDGYSTWQATLRVQQIKEHLPIKRVLLTFFTGNDFQDNERFLAMKRSPLPGPAGSPIPRPTIPNSEIWLMQHSYIYAHYRIWNKVQQLGSPHDFSKGNWQDELRLFTLDGEKRRSQLRNQSKRALQQLRDYTRQNNMELMVAIAPPAFVIHPERLNATFDLVDLDPKRADVDAPQQLVRDILTELKIDYCDLSPALRDANQPYLTFDGHWTLEGHTVVADAIATCWGIP